MKDYFLQIKQMHQKILHSSSLESQLAFFRMGRVLLDFWMQREIAQHFVLGEKSCQLYLPPSLFPAIVMALLALNIVDSNEN